MPRPPLVLMLAVVTSACAASLDSAVTDAAAVRDARVVGEWATVAKNGQTEFATVTPAGAQAYALRYIDERHDTAYYEARLGRYGNDYLLDLVAGNGVDTVVKRYAGLLLHTQLTLRFDPAGVSLNGFVLDSLKAYLRSGRLKLRYTQRPNNGDLILTDSGAVLGPALAAFARRSGVLTDPMVYHKRP